MNLYITDSEVQLIQGVHFPPSSLALKITHLILASRDWDTLFIDLEECIPEGWLRYLPTKCKEIQVCVPDTPSMHQLHLLIELFPHLDGTLRKAYLKGENINALLPKVWQHGA